MGQRWGGVWPGGVVWMGRPPAPQAEEDEGNDLEVGFHRRDSVVGGGVGFRDDGCERTDGRISAHGGDGRKEGVGVEGMSGEAPDE